MGCHGHLLLRKMTLWPYARLFEEMDAEAQPSLFRKVEQIVLVIGGGGIELVLRKRAGWFETRKLQGSNSR